MAEFTVNPTRHDPYKNFKFQVKWDGKYVAGISKVTGLKRTTEVVKFRDGADPSTSRKSPGRNEYDAITLERGITEDTAFEQWAGKVWRLGAALGAEVSLADFRKDIILELYNEAGQKVLAYNIYRCWVSEYQAMPDLDANANAVAIQHIKLENEGWERDLSDDCAGQSLARRGLRFLMAACPGMSADALAALTIGERDARLLALRQALWGPEMVAVATCPACRERIEMTGRDRH